MKTSLGIVLTVTVLLAANTVHAQLNNIVNNAELDAIENTTPLSAAELPVIGTYYSAANPQNPPAPANVLGLTGWVLDAKSGIYLLDDLDTSSVAAGFHSMGAMDDSGPLPPGSGDGDGGGYSFTNTYPGFPTNGLWLQITNISDGSVYANLNGATDFVYAVLSCTNLTTTASNWGIESEVFPGSNTNTLPFSVPMNGRSSLFLWAMDWTGVTANGNQTPLWWLYYWYGAAGLSLFDSTLDLAGNSLLYDYTNNVAPVTFQFLSIQATNNYVNSIFAPVQLNVVGNPYYIAISVDDTNYANDASWNAYSSSNVAVNLGLTQGWHNVWIGLYGRGDSPTNAVWWYKRLKLDYTPPMLVITNPALSTVCVPMIQVQGYCPENLASISYDLSNAVAVVTNQSVSIHDRYYDTNTFELTTNTFQCFDVPLTNGLNSITLHATDMAGNVTTTNFCFTLDYSSKTNPPVVSLYWPQNGTLICSTNYTWRGWVADPTVTVAAQTVDTNGDTNTFNAIVERDGNFWVQNIPLSNGTNYLTLCVTDVVGNVTITNIMVCSGNIGLTINTPSSDQLWSQGITVNGTISDSSDYTLWVNGNEATLNGDGTWTATNVYLPTGGTAVIQARAIPNIDNGGNGTGGSGGGPVTYDNLGNPDPAADEDAEAQTDKPMRIWVATYTESDNGFTDEKWTSPTSWSEDYQTGQNSVNWSSTSGGSANWTWEEIISGSNVNPPTTNTDWSNTSWPSSDPNNGWEVDEDNDNTGPVGSPVVWEHCNLGVPLVDMTGPWLGGTLTEKGTRNAQAIVKLQTGGKGTSNKQNLFEISASATQIVAIKEVSPWTNMVPYLPVPPQSITILGQALGSDGNLWITEPDNTELDVTPNIQGMDYYTFNVGAGKYHPYITANGTDLDCQTPTFIVGQPVTFVLNGLPTSQIVNMIGKWSLPGTFVNEGYQYSSTCYSYRLDSTLLLNTNTTSCWYQNQPGGAVSVGMDLLFNNGQSAAVAANGNINVVRPSIVNLFGSTPSVSFDTNSDSQDDNSVQCNCSFSAQVQVPYPFSGQAQYTQLVQVNANYGSSILGVCSSTTDTTSGQFWLDNTYPYPDNGSPWSIAWSDNPLKYLQHSDSPGYGPTLCDSVSVVENFKTYLQFQPPGGIPVTIGRFDWGWQCNYTENGGIWSGGGSAYGPDQESDDSFPVWLEVYSNSR